MGKARKICHGPSTDLTPWKILVLNHPHRPFQASCFCSGPCRPGSQLDNYQSRNKIARVGAFAVLDRRGVASGYAIPDHGLLAMLPVVQNDNEIELIFLSDSSSTSMTDQRYDKGVEHAEAQGEPPSETKTRAIIDRGPPIEDAETWNLYNVMLIGWRDRVAVRKGSGKIYKRAIQYALAPGPVWKSILLG